MISVQEHGTHLLDYWHVLLKRRWIIYTSVAVAVTTVMLGSLLMVPTYTATCRLQIERDVPNVLPFQQVTPRDPDYLWDFYETQYGLIRSRRVAREVIHDLALGGQPDFEVGEPRGLDPDVPAEEVVENARIDILLDRLDVRPVRKSRLVDVSFSSRDKVLAAKVANRVAETYIAFNSQAQYNTTERASTSLTHQIEKILEETDSKEKQLQTYAREHGIIPLNEKQDIILKNLNDLSNSYMRTKAVRIEKEAELAALRESEPEYIPDGAGTELLDELTAKAAEIERQYAQLSDKYQPGWPQMVSLRSELEQTREHLGRERAKVRRQALDSATAAYNTARKEEGYLQAALDDLKKQAQELGIKEIEYNNLKAEIANKKETLDALVRRQTETTTTAGLTDLVNSNVRVVDPAEIPTSPTSPKLLLNLLLSLLGGTGAGVGLAYFFEYLDKSVKTPEEMRAAMGLPPLGALPVLEGAEGRLRLVEAAAGGGAQGPRADLVSHEAPKSQLAEAFRELRTALLVSRPGGPPRTILITSSQPEEGKTAVAINLAISIAQMGRSVLLVDADMRKPRLSKVFGLPEQEGLSNVLSGSDSPKGWIRATAVPGLSLLGSGPTPPNPADLLDSHRFAEVLRQLELQEFDHIIYDSPPVLAVADATIVSGKMDSVLVVVWAGKTGRDLLSHTMTRLRQVKAPVVGGVLNKFDVKQGYYAGYYAKKYYGQDGAAGDDEHAKALEAAGRG